MGYVSGTLSSKGRKRSFLLCYLSKPLVSPGSPQQCWSLYPRLRHPLLQATMAAELGEGRNGRDEPLLVLTKHITVLGHLESEEDVWRRSLGINDPWAMQTLGSTLNYSEERNSAAHSPPVRAQAFGERAICCGKDGFPEGQIPQEDTIPKRLV